MPSSGIWRRVDLVWSDVSDERIASIFKVEKSTSEKPAWAGGCERRFTQNLHGARSIVEKTHGFVALVKAKPLRPNALVVMTASFIGTAVKTIPNAIKILSDEIVKIVKH
jgi:hypothetical protein